MIPWNQHFFASTRGRIVLLLRRGKHTVDELAHQLGLTDNAVRAHLLSLERDHLVRQAGTRRGSGKPALLYDLTSEAEHLFPQAYLAVLHELLAVLSEDLPAEQRTRLMQHVGRRLARQWQVPTSELRERLRQTVTLLNELGGAARWEEEERAYFIQSHHCPFALLVPAYPEVCQMAQTLLTELLGVPVIEQCEQNEAARCRFTVART